jgi:indole-3-glycerol phosphate synthase
MKPLEQDHILTKIVEAKQARLRKSRMRVPEAVVRRMAHEAEHVPSFCDALQCPKPIRIIAEIKKASPSKGTLRAQLDAEELAGAYAHAGAVAISVVTEEDFFQGDLAWIAKVHRVSNSPVLRKDFVFDPIQVYETRAAGASALLLIAAMLTTRELRQLLNLAREIHLDALVEVHDEAELEEALEAGAQIVGVNNRDLKTFDVNIGTSLRLAQRIPNDRLFVVESGIHSSADIARLLEAGADAFLIGEHLITADDPGSALRGLL